MTVAEIAAPAALGVPPLPQARLVGLRHAVDVAAFAAVIVSLLASLAKTTQG